MATIRNSIRTWALVAVALTSAAVIAFLWWLIDLLAQPDWCARALGAAKYVGGRPEFAVTGCYDLIMRQVEAIALNTHYLTVTLSLCLLVLVVIVLAGGRLSFTAGKEGVSANIEHHEKAAAAHRVADAAEDEADRVAEEG